MPNNQGIKEPGIFSLLWIFCFWISSLFGYYLGACLFMGYPNSVFYCPSLSWAFLSISMARAFTGVLICWAVAACLLPAVVIIHKNFNKHQE